MRNFLLTTALVLPLGAGLALAQDTAPDANPMTGTTTDAAPPVTPDAAAAAGDAADAAGDAAATAGDAAMDAADAAGDAAMDAADAAGDAANAAADAVTTTDTTTTATTMDAAATDAVATADSIVQVQDANELRVEWILDSAVTSPAGERIGDVNDLIIDGDTGAMKAAVVGVGGFLGIGEKQIAIEWSRLTVNFDANQITTELTREEAEAAPGYQFREQQNQPAADATTTTTTTTDTTATTVPADAATDATETAPASN